MKTIKSLLVLSLLTSFNLLFSQNDSLNKLAKHKFSFGYFLSYPFFNEFTIKISGDEMTGHADPGNALTLGYHYNFNSNNAITLNYARFNNSINFDDIVDGLRANSRNGRTFSLTSDGYTVNTLFLGYQYTYNISNRVALFLSPQIGLGGMKLREITYTSVSTDGIFDVTEVQRENDPINSIILGLNAGFEFTLTKFVSLSLLLDYVNSNFTIDTEFEHTNTSTNIPTIAFTNKINFEQAFEAINTGIRLGINF